MVCWVCLPKIRWSVVVIVEQGGYGGEQPRWQASDHKARTGCTERLVSWSVVLSNRYEIWKDRRRRNGLAYSAKDTLLNRLVAVKFYEQYANDSEFVDGLP